MEDRKFYTLLIYTEHTAGVLSQVTAVFTRRQVNIESINASSSSINGVHKYTITAWSTEDQIIKITKQIEKKIGVIKADYYTDEQLFIHEVALYKLSTPAIMANPNITSIIRRADAQMIEVNPTFCSVMKNGKTEDIMNLYHSLDQFNCILQYIRSGRMAGTRRKVEEVTAFLDLQERLHGGRAKKSEGK